MQDPAKEAKIVVTVNGPYIVSGGVPLDIQTITPNTDGGSWTWTQGRTFEPRATYALCRCGQSSNKPYCDGTHARVGFDGTETASRAPFDEQASTIGGSAMDLKDAEPLCAFARFCDNAGGIWSLVEDSDQPGIEKIVVHEETHCPSGRLVLRDKRSNTDIEPDLPKSITLVEDPEKDCSGPLWVRGGIRIESLDGTPYEVRNRQTLCRCGASTNKPFCDGTHAETAFNDGLMEEKKVAG